MEKNTGTRRPKTNSPAKRKSLISRVKAEVDASVQGVRQILGSLRNTIPPPRDIVIVVAVTGVSFTFGFFVGRGVQQSVLPGEFVSIQEIDIHGTSSRLADATEDPARQDIAAGLPSEGADAGGNEKDAPPASEKDVPPTSMPVADIGVVGPVPTETREVKSEAPSRESVASTKEKMIMPVQGRVVSGFGWRKQCLLKVLRRQ